MIITSLERVPRRKRVQLFVDGRFALELSSTLAAERGLRAGREITVQEVAALSDEDAHRVALETALRLLSHRPRSERELRDRLLRKGVGKLAADDAVRRMRELGYIDDAAFARFWAETRQAARPRARRVVVGELRRQGIEGDDAEEATVDISDEGAAYEAASRRLHAFRLLEYQPFRERLGRFLTSRGFSYDVARRTIDRCWAEVEAVESPATTRSASRAWSDPTSP